MQSFGTDRILATRRVGDLPYHILRDIWNSVGALERNTLRRAGQGVEWLALRLQSLRRGHVERKKLRPRRIRMAMTGPFYGDREPGPWMNDYLRGRVPGASWRRLLRLDRYARINPDRDSLGEITMTNAWDYGFYYAHDRDEWRHWWIAMMGLEFTTLRI